MSGESAGRLEAARTARRALRESGPWMTYLACPEDPVRIVRSPDLLAALHPRAHRKPNGDPLFWDFFAEAAEGYCLQVVKQGASGGPVRPIFWACIGPEGVVELARPVGSRIFTPDRPALGSHGVALEAMGLFAFSAWLYRRVGYTGFVQAGLALDRAAGLVLDPHPDGQAGEASLQSDTLSCAARLGVAELRAGGRRLVSAFLDALYHETAQAPCPHFAAGGSLRPAGSGSPPRTG